MRSIMFSGYVHCWSLLITAFIIRSGHPMHF